MSPKKKYTREQRLEQGERLREAINDSGMKVEKFAREAGYSKAYIYKVIAGNVNLPTDTAQDLCRPLNLHEHWLLTGDLPKNRVGAPAKGTNQLRAIEVLRRSGTPEPIIAGIESAADDGRSFDDWLAAADEVRKSLQRFPELTKPATPQSDTPPPASDVAEIPPVPIRKRRA